MGKLDAKSILAAGVIGGVGLIVILIAGSLPAPQYSTILQGTGFQTLIVFVEGFLTGVLVQVGLRVFDLS